MGSAATSSSRVSDSNVNVSSTSSSTLVPLPLSKKAKLKHGRVGVEMSLIECLKNENPELYTEVYCLNLRQSYVDPTWPVFYGAVDACSLLQIKQGIKALELQVNLKQKKHALLKSIMEQIETRAMIKAKEKENVCNIALVIKALLVENVSIETGVYVFIERSSGEADYYNNGMVYFSAKVSPGNSTAVCVFTQDVNDFYWKSCCADASNFRVLFDKNYREA